jgi:hypothetical protein
MPYKSGKMKGELTTTEIRKLIRAHNVLVSIKIPKGSKREDIMAIVKKAGYMVDHEKQALRPVSKGKVKKLPVVDMNKATQVLPKPKTKEEKAVAKKSKDMKKKEKEDKIKAEGVKQGAALQKVISKRNVKKVEQKKEDEVRPKSKVGRPRVDPSKIKVIEPKKKEEPKKKSNFDRDVNIKFLKFTDDEKTAIKKYFKSIEEVPLTITFSPLYRELSINMKKNKKATYKILDNKAPMNALAKFINSGTFFKFLPTYAKAIVKTINVKRNKAEDKGSYLSIDPKGKIELYSDSDLKPSLTNMVTIDLKPLPSMDREKISIPYKP